MKLLRTAFIILLPFVALLIAISPQLHFHAQTPDDRSDVQSILAPYKFKTGVTVSYEKEIRFYQKRVSLDPTNYQDLAILAGAYMKTAKLNQDPNMYMLAQKTAQESMDHFPVENGKALRLLAQMAEAKHDFREALRIVDEIRAFDKKNEDVLPIRVTSNLGLGRIDEAAAAGEEMVAKEPTLGTYTELFLVREAQGRDKDAMACMRKALELEEPGEPVESAKARIFFGRYFFRRGRYTVAQDLYLEAMRIMPTMSLAFAQMAELQARLGQYDAAEGHYGEAYNLSPLAIYVEGKAWVKRLRGDPTGAAQYDRKAEAMLRRDLTSSPIGHGRDLARLLLQRVDGNPNPAADPGVVESVKLMEAEVKNRRDPETMDIYAWALSAAGRYDEAERAEQEALNSGFRLVDIYYRAACIEQKLGHTEAARRYFQSVVDLNPHAHEADLSRERLTALAASR